MGGAGPRWLRTVGRLRAPDRLRRRLFAVVLPRDEPVCHSSGETGEAGNVFFGTTARLVPQDTDEAGDVYDARIDGGFPEPAGEGPCKGNACESPTPAPCATRRRRCSAPPHVGPAPQPSPRRETKVTKKTIPRCKRG